MNKQLGFTLIELIVVMIVLGVLAVTVVPKLIGSSRFAARTTADQYIAHLRLVQLKAMNHTGVCQNSVFDNDNSVFGMPINADDAPCGTVTAANSQIALGDSRITLVNGSSNADIQAFPQIVFDSRGIPSAGSCSGACKLKVTAVDSVYVCIESQGYIHRVASAYVCI
jgi:MSHA pilin protein MshC